VGVPHRVDRSIDSGGARLPSVPHGARQAVRCAPEARRCESRGPRGRPPRHVGVHGASSYLRMTGRQNSLGSVRPCGLDGKKGDIRRLKQIARNRR
jgi:hypothetical protein